MEQNSWEASQMHVMSQLEELKAHAEKANDDHARVREDLANIRADICSFKTHQKWELRILSAVWGLVVMALNALIPWRQ